MSLGHRDRGACVGAGWMREVPRNAWAVFARWSIVQHVASEPPQLDPRAASTDVGLLIVGRWGPAFLRVQSLQLIRSFPLSFGVTAGCLALGTFLALAVHWAWAVCALIAAVWLGRQEEALRAPFLAQPLHPALVRDAKARELLVLVGFVEHSDELSAVVARVPDRHWAPWLRRYRTGDPLTVGLVEHDGHGVRAVPVEAITRDRTALRTAHESIPQQARRVLELACLRFDASQHSTVQQIALGPGRLVDDEEDASFVAPIGVAKQSEPYRVFAGLAEHGAVPFTPALVEHMTAALRREQRFGVATLLLALVGPVCLTLAFTGADRPLYSPALAAAGFLGSALCPLLLWGAFDRLRLARRYAADVAQGSLALFGGKVTLYEATFGDPQQAWLIDRRLLDPEPNKTQSVGIGHATRRVWLANERPVSELLFAHVALIAPLPDEAHDEPLPPGLQLEVPDGFRVKSRALTAHEQDELAGHVRRLQRVGLGMMFVLVSLLLLAGFFAWAGTMPWPRVTPLMLFALVGWLGMLTSALLRQRSAGALGRDLELGRCAVLLPSYAESLTRPELRSELLPFSRRPWSHMGRPAPWRGVQH